MKLEVERLTKRLGGRAVLDRLDLRCEGPEITAILGENGSGKSTLLRIVAGVLLPDSGVLKLDGAPLDSGDRAGRRHIGYVPEANDAMPHLSVAELLALWAALKRAPPAPRALVERLGVTPILGQRTGTLSLGQRRRVGLVAALLGSPWLLVLDEPTNGLDPDGAELLVALLREHVQGGGAVLVATHDLPFCSALDARRLRLVGGQLCTDRADAPEQSSSAP